MSHHRLLLPSLLVFAAAASSFACAKPKMLVDPALAQSSERYAIEVNKSLTSYNAIGFGPYVADDLDVSLTSTSSARVGPVSGSDTSKTFAVKLSANGKTYGAE